MKDRYDSVEFGTIKYMATSGGISCADADARIGYYNLTGYPTCWFNGTTAVVGASADMADGSSYDPLVQAMLDDATPVMLSITDYEIVSFGQSHVDISVELSGDIADISNHYIRVAVVENELWYSPRTYQDVVRDMLPDTPLTIETDGQTQNFTVSFNLADMDYVDIANMWIAVWVQNDTDKSMLQSCNSLPIPDYSFRYYALGERVAVDSGVHDFGDFAVFNTGLMADDYYLTLDVSQLPPGWSGYITDGVSNFTNMTVSLAPGESAEYHVVVDAASTGSGTADLLIHSVGNRTDDRVFGYTVITSDVEILLVDDDGAEDYESIYFAPALAATGHSFAIWDRNAASLTGSLLSNFDAVVWNVGWAFPTFDAEDRPAITEYLQGGGAIFVTGQDIGWELEDEGGDAYTWYRETLGATFVSDDTNAYALTGVAGDPITDGLSINTSGGDGANNQQYPSDIDPWGGDSHVIFTYDANRNGAVAKDDGIYRCVYFAFGYEAIDNPADRAIVMDRVITWLLRDMTGAPGETPVFVTRLDQNLPNPFNPKTRISYTLSAAGEIRLEVFDPEGRLLRVLDEGARSAGTHRAVWDGRDETGRSQASGVYFYRLSGTDQPLTRKMLLLK